MQWKAQIDHFYTKDLTRQKSARRVNKGTVVTERNVSTFVETQKKMIDEKVSLSFHV